MRQPKGVPPVLDGVGRGFQRCIGVPHAHGAPREAATAGGFKIGVRLDCCRDAQDGFPQVLQHTVLARLCKSLTNSNVPR